MSKPNRRAKGRSGISLRGLAGSRPTAGSLEIYGIPPVHRVRRELSVLRFEQPDDVTCGPSCLRQVFHHYDDRKGFSEILAATPRNPDGGTLAVYLGLAAIRFGYDAALYPNDLRIFDPTWFELPRKRLKLKLEQRADAVSEPKLKSACQAHIDFLQEGGRIEFAELSPRLLMRILDRSRPVICGLSSTYLYRRIRERPDDNEDDDIHGEPTGHFVVVSGYTNGGKSFIVRDPSTDVPFSARGRYIVPAQRLIHSILLGDATHDAVLLEIWPPIRKGRAS